MNMIDKYVIVAVVAVLGAVLVRALLEAAMMLVLPVVILAAGYGGWRAWQIGLIGKKGRLRNDVQESR